MESPPTGDAGIDAAYLGRFEFDIAGDERGDVGLLGLVVAEKVTASAFDEVLFEVDADAADVDVDVDVAVDAAAKDGEDVGAWSSISVRCSFLIFRR
ncbi:hypothetical protein BGZ58_006588 [Dissophora ornata]|nr:hypothetical protein BGZ58_006588 [Dissophora ornata]